MWTRYWPATKKLNELIKDGAIGDIQFLDGTYGHKAEEKIHKQRLVKPELGGGVLV